MPISIFCLGKTRENWIKLGINEYAKRLQPVWKIRWIELKDASLKTEGSIEKVKLQEATTLLKAIPAAAYVIALDEKGKDFDSPAFAHELGRLVQDKEIAILIGGVYGLDKTVRERADLCLSFSTFTFPHQLIRVILMEQLYRAWTILSGKTYHY